MKNAIPYTLLWPGAILWTIFTGAVLAWGTWCAWQNHLFADHAVHEFGTVEQKSYSISHGRHGTTSYTYFVAYHYSAGDYLMECRTSCPAASWNQLAEQGSIPIKYLPEAIGRNRIDMPADNQIADTTATIGLGLGLLSLFGGAAVFRYLRHRNQLQRRLVASGLTCMGRVTDVDVVRGSKGSTSAYLNFEFADDRGQVIQGRTWRLNSRQIDYWERGKAIKVFFDARDPETFTVDLEPSRYMR